MSSALLERIFNFSLQHWNINTTVMHTQNQQEKETEICFEYDNTVGL